MDVNKLVDAWPSSDGELSVDVQNPGKKPREPADSKAVQQRGRDAAQRAHDLDRAMRPARAPRFEARTVLHTDPVVHQIRH